MAETVYEGCCHCGTIGYRYVTAVPLNQWPVRACQCAFCRAHVALSTSDPQGSVAFSTDDESRLQRYRFALKTADFLLCRSCGVYIGAAIETDAGRFGIINTRALAPVHDGIAAVAPISYDDEDTGSRIARREKRWTPVTAVPWQHIGV